VNAAARRPTRLVFVDTLADGQGKTVIDACSGAAPGCPLKIEHPPGEHDLTILDTRQGFEVLIMIVVDSATGEQCILTRRLIDAVRIYADTEQGGKP
jgi:hypothetical protein